MSYKRQTKNSNKNPNIEDDTNLDETVVNALTDSRTNKPQGTSTPTAAPACQVQAGRSLVPQMEENSISSTGLNLMDTGVPNIYRKHIGAKVRERWQVNPALATSSGSNTQPTGLLQTPISFSERRSPSPDTESEDGLSTDLNITKTPFGAGAYHQLEAQPVNTQLEYILPEHSTLTDIENSIYGLRE